MREQTYSEVVHPDFIGQSAVIVDPTAMNDLVDRLHNGDPALGWEGDNRLTLAFHKPTQQWELWRLEADNQYRLFARSKPGKPFPGDIIRELVAHDTRRGFDPKAYVDEHNAKIKLEQEKQQTERNLEFADRLAWAIKKDTRTGAGI